MSDMPSRVSLATDQAHLMHPLHHPSAYAAGDKVQIEIRRGDKLTAINLELAPLPKR